MSHTKFKNIVENNVEVIYKEPGYTMNQIIIPFKNENNKLCFAGRLDPMARGKVILLYDDECKNISKYKHFKKTYQFEIIMGIQTDSDDPLGIIEMNIIDCINNQNNTSTDNKVYNQISSDIKSNILMMTFCQKFHHYSSKCINGKPLWYYKKNNILIDLPTHIVSIYDYEINDIKSYNFNEWKTKIVNQIQTIDKSCNFNQEFIINQWNNMNDIKKIYSIPITLTVSSGFYVRQFVRDLSDKIKIPLMTFDINRTDIFE